MDSESRGSAMDISNRLVIESAVSKLFMLLCHKMVGLPYSRGVKGMKKNIFETSHNEMKSILSIKESNFNGKKGSKFSHLLMVKAEGADPFTVSPTA